MKSSWRFFFMIELLLLIWAFWQIPQNTPIMVMFIIAVVNLIYALKKIRKNSFNQFQIIGSIVFMVIFLMSSPAIWLMLIFAVVFICLKGVSVSGIDVFHKAPWKEKQMIIVETTGSETKSGRRFKRSWFGNERIGSNVYEWDDINFSLVAGDTIIDLGNTLLPKEDSIILIRKGFGRTRILVPVGVGVVLEHSTLSGAVIFDDRKYELRNESLKIYSDDYNANPRRLKIVTNTLIGDLEVIRV